MRAFFNGLFETGHVAIFPEPRNPVTSRLELLPVIKDFDRVARLNLFGEAPDLRPSVAIWAAGLLYDCCQLLVLRNLGEAQILAVLQEPCPESPRLPATLYSADLFLSYMPSVLDLARRLAPGDPLVFHLEHFGTRWPLSCVGMQLREPPIQPFHFLQHAGLKQLYADRIIEWRAYNWIMDLAIFETVKASYGNHPELCPGLEHSLASLSSVASQSASATPALAAQTQALNPVSKS